MRKIIFIPLWILLSMVCVNAKVVVYPAPVSETLSVDYVIEVDGKLIPVYTALTQHHDKKYSIAYFDFSGSVTVKIKSKFSLEKLIVLPNKYGICPSIHQDEAIFQLDKPCDISFEPNGCNSPLLLLTNEIEKDIPSKDNPNVIYFGPGVHNPENGLIKLSSNQTLYLAGGAIVNAGVEATGDNITICGRGILDCSDWEHNAGPTDYMINLNSATLL